MPGGRPSEGSARIGYKISLQSRPAAGAHSMKDRF